MFAVWVPPAVPVLGTPRGFRSGCPPRFPFWVPRVVPVLSTPLGAQFGYRPRSPFQEPKYGQVFIFFLIYLLRKSEQVGHINMDALLRISSTEMASRALKWPCLAPQRDLQR